MRIQSSHNQSTRKVGRFTRIPADSTPGRPCRSVRESSPSRRLNAVLQGLLAVALAVAAPLVASGIADQAVASQDAEPLVAQADAVPGPEVANFLDDIIDDLINILSQTQAVVDNQTGPLPPAERPIVADDLAYSLALIDEMFDTSEADHIDPSAGGIDASVNPQSLPDYAKTATNLARAAQAELNIGGNFNQDYVATKLKTIEHLITRDEPHSYRSLAGIQ